MGISVQTSGIKVEQGRFYLVNLNADPSLNELLVYYLKAKNLVGLPDAVVAQDIQLLGLGIMSEHCIIDIEGADVLIMPLEGARFVKTEFVFFLFIFVLFASATHHESMS